MKKKAAIIIGPRFQDQEFFYPFYRLQEAGLKVDVATTDKKDVPGDFGMIAKATIDTKKLKPADYDVVVLPGGAKSLEKIRQDKHALNFIKKMHAAGKVVAAVCHGTQLLISAGVLKGKKATGYYSIADDISNAGATYLNQPVVVDDNLITSPHYKDMPQWMIETLRKLRVRSSGLAG